MGETPQTVEKAIAYALAQVGKPYVWGGIGPRGYDCSGLTSQAYKAGGIYVPRTAGAQRLVGTKVDGTWLPGDLIFPRAPSSPSGNHVVMYIGGGRVVEAPRTGLNVRVGDPPAKSEILAVRRMVKTNQTAWAAQYQKAGFGLGDFDPFGPAREGPLGDIAGGAWDAVTGPWGFGFPGKVWENGDEIVDGTKTVLDAAAFLINPHNWYRVGMFLLGAAALYVALKSAGNLGAKIPEGLPQ